jgi:hypothetical protein
MKIRKTKTGQMSINLPMWVVERLKTILNTNNFKELNIDPFEEQWVWVINKNGLPELTMKYWDLRKTNIKHGGGNEL